MLWFVTNFHKIHITPQVPEFFGESVSFGGGLVECSVNQCLVESGEASGGGAKNCVVGEESFNRFGHLTLRILSNSLKMRLMRVNFSKQMAHERTPDHSLAAHPLQADLSKGSPARIPV